MGWHTDPAVTSNVKFEATNQRDNFDPECLRSDVSYHTVSFIYEVQVSNESIFIAYDKPYTFSQDLKYFIDSIRNKKEYRSYLQI